MKTEYIILAKNRGDYITRLKFESNGDFEIHGGSAANAIRYSLEEATSLLEHLGRGYSIEEAEFSTGSFAIDHINKTVYARDPEGNWQPIANA